MKRSFNSNVIRQIVGAISWNFLGMLFSLVNGVITARLLDPDNRGLLALSLSISSISYLMSSMGTNSAVRTLQPREAWASFRSYIYVSALLLVLNAVTVVVVVLVFIQIGFVAFSEHVLVIALLGTLTFAANQLLDMYNAAGRTSTSAMANTVGHFVTMVSLLFVTFFLPLWADLVGVWFCYALSYVARIVSMLFTAHKYKFDYGTFSLSGGTLFMRASMRFWAIGLSRTLTFRADQFLLAIFSNAHNVGLYAVAVTPSSLMQVVSNSIGQVAYREAATGNITAKRLSKFLALGLASSLTYAIVMWLLAPYLMPLVFGPDYADTVPVVRILVIAGVILSPYHILVPILTGLNSPYLSALSGVIGILTLAPAMLILAPQHGAVGAAISTVISYSAMLLVAVIGVSIRMQRVRHKE